MKRAISGYFENPILKKNLNFIVNKPKKRKKLTTSTSEKCVFTKNKDCQVYYSNRSKFNEEYKVKNINIKFDILQNLKKHNTIFNHKSHIKLKKVNQENKQKNSKFNKKLLKNDINIPKLIINKEKINNYLDEKITEKNNEKNKQTQLDPHGYFPDDFSLNIYKSTCLYKNRYKIESCRLKKVLKNIYIKENSKKNKNLINIIKKNTIKNNVSTKMFKLLKSKKIDRFVNRYLNVDISSKNNNNKNETSKNNNSFNKIKKKIFITNKKKEITQLKCIDSDEIDKKANILIHPYTNIISNEKNKININFNRNFSNDNIKTNTANSATQTLNINDTKNKNSACNLYDSENKSFIDKNKNSLNINNTPSFKDKYYNFKEIKFEMIKYPKKEIFLKKFQKMMRPFSASKTNSYNNINKNDVNNLNKDKKLIFSFYDPKDKYIQLFDELQKRAKDSNINNAYYNKN